jgi:hypothetical protein
LPSSKPMIPSSQDRRQYGHFQSVISGASSPCSRV